MPQDYGPAQPLVSTLRTWERRLNPAEWISRSTPATPARPDTSWHDEMVRKATESFTRNPSPRAEQQTPVAYVPPPTTPKRVPKRTTPVRTPPRTPPRTGARTPQRVPPRAAAGKRR